MTPRAAARAAPAPRPAPADAVTAGCALLDEGEPVDVQRVARRLGVSRATVHRWFGTRDQLVTAVFDRLATGFIAQARHDARGRGDERAFDFVRRLADRSAAYEPLRLTAAREPGLTLRLILDEDGPVQRQVVEAVREELARSRPPAELTRLEPAVRLLVSTAIALHWAAIAAGRDPDSRRYVDLGRAVLAQADDGLPRSR